MSLTLNCLYDVTSSVSLSPQIIWQKFFHSYERRLPSKLTNRGRVISFLTPSPEWVKICLPFEYPQSYAFPSQFLTITDFCKHGNCMSYKHFYGINFFDISDTWLDTYHIFHVLEMFLKIDLTIWILVCISFKHHQDVHIWNRNTHSFITHRIHKTYLFTRWLFVWRWWTGRNFFISGLQNNFSKRCIML